MHKSLSPVCMYVYIIFIMYTDNSGNACEILLYMYVYERENGHSVHVHVQRLALA